MHAAGSDVWPLSAPSFPTAHGTHVWVAVLFFHHPAGHPALGTQNLFVASHHAPAPQSEAPTAHTVEAASVGLMQQHRRWSGPFDAAQVETPPFGHIQLP